MNRTVATIGIAAGLLSALAAGIFFTSGHGLAATLCAVTTVALGLHAFRQPV